MKTKIADLKSDIRVKDGRSELDVRRRVWVRSREVNVDLVLEPLVDGSFNTANMTGPAGHRAVVYWEGRYAGCDYISHALAVYR